MGTFGLNKPIKVLICDDSAFLRVTLRKIIESDPLLQVLDVARNGAEAVEKAIRLKPDVVTMDVFMPLVDGLTALKDIVRMKIAPVIMLSSFTPEDAQATIEAIEAGAFDFIPKPNEVETLEIQTATIIQKIKQAAASNIYHKSFTGKQPLSAAGRISKENKSRLNIPNHRSRTSSPVSAPSGTSLRLPDFKTVALGLSTGGPKSIFTVLPFLPPDLNAAVIVVQHMPPAFISTFTQRLNNHTPMDCRETETGMKIQPSKIYVAKGGVHLKLLQQKNGDIVIRHSTDPQHLFMPAIDIAMNSVCEVFGKRTIGVIMTGMGRDGAEGMLNIRKAGGITIAESEETAVVFGMPKEAIKLGGAQFILPNWEIAPHIINAVGDKL